MKLEDWLKILAMANGYLAAVEGGYSLIKAVVAGLKGMTGHMDPKSQEEAEAAIAAFEGKLAAAAAKNAAWLADHQV